MKNSTILNLVTCLVLFGKVGLFASPGELTPELLQKFASTNTFNGEQITPKNILQLMPHQCIKRSDFIRSWLKRHEDLAKIMSGQEAFEGENPVVTQGQSGRAEYYKQTQERIEEEGNQTLSQSSNTVILIDDLVAKASSLANRHKNLDAQFGKGYGHQITPEELEEFNTKYGGQTFQTISRAATYLRGLEAKRLFNLDKVNFPETTLEHIPGRPEDVCDTNFVTVEKKIKPVADLQDHALALDEKIMEQMTILIGYTALWNMVGSGGNIFVVKNPQTGELETCFHDLEQPNMHRKPSNFFNQDTQAYVSNIHHGWADYEDNVIKKYAQRVENSVEDSSMPDDQKGLLKKLLHDRLEMLIKKKADLQTLISQQLPK